MQTIDANRRIAAPTISSVKARGTDPADSALVIGLLCTVVVTWSLTYVLLRVGMRYSPPEMFAILRTTTGGALLCAAALALGRPFPRGWRTHAWLLACGVGGSSIFLTAMNYGATYVSAGETSLLIYTQPFWIALLARWLLGQPLNRVRILGLVIGFAGVATVAFGKIHVDASPAWNAYLVLTVGTFAFSVSAIWFVRHLRGVTLEWAVGLQNVYGGIALIPAWLIFERGQLPISAPGFWVAFLFTSVGSTFLAQTAYSSLLRRRDATVTSAYTFLVPILATLGGFLFLGESISVATLIGGAAVAAGIFLVNRRPSRQPAEGVQGV